MCDSYELSALLKSSIHALWMKTVTESRIWKGRVNKRQTKLAQFGWFTSANSSAAKPRFFRSVWPSTNESFGEDNNAVSSPRSWNVRRCRSSEESPSVDGRLNA